MVGDESPQCSTVEGVLDSEVENLLLSAPGLSIPEPTLVLSKPQFPPLHMDVASMGPPATFPWLRGSGFWAMWVFPELQDPSLISGWTAPVVFQGGGEGSQLSASGQHHRLVGLRTQLMLDLGCQVGCGRAGSSLPEQKGRDQQW